MKDIDFTPLPLPGSLAHELIQLLEMLGNVVHSWEAMFLKMGWRKKVRGWRGEFIYQKKVEKLYWGSSSIICHSYNIQSEMHLSKKEQNPDKSSEAFKQIKTEVMLVKLGLFKNNSFLSISSMEQNLCRSSTLCTKIQLFFF